MFFKIKNSHIFYRTTFASCNFYPLKIIKKFSNKNPKIAGKNSKKTQKGQKHKLCQNQKPQKTTAKKTTTHLRPPPASFRKHSFTRNPPSKHPNTTKELIQTAFSLEQVSGKDVKIIDWDGRAKPLSPSIPFPTERNTAWAMLRMSCSMARMTLDLCRPPMAACS